MSQPQFDIRIDTHGKMTIKVSGTSGEECAKLTDMLARIVGIEDSREYTSEHRSPGVTARISGQHASQQTRTQ